MRVIARSLAPKQSRGLNAIAALASLARNDTFRVMAGTTQERGTKQSPRRDVVPSKARDLLLIKEY